MNFKEYLIEDQKISDKEITALVAEHELIAEQLAIYSELVKRYAGRSDEINKTLMPIVKECTGQTLTVKSSIMKFTSKSSSRSTVKYKEVVEEALRIVNEDQHKVIKAFQDSVTSISKSESEFLGIESSKVQKIVEKAKAATTIEQLKALSKEALEIKVSVDEGIKEVLKTAYIAIKTYFGSLMGLLKNSKKSVNYLESVV